MGFHQELYGMHRTGRQIKGMPVKKVLFLETSNLPTNLSSKS